MGNSGMAYSVTLVVTVAAYETIRLFFKKVAVFFFSVQKSVLTNKYLQTSKTFLMRMFVVFFDLTEPASRKANPACITAR